MRLALPAWSRALPGLSSRGRRLFLASIVREHGALFWPALHLTLGTAALSVLVALDVGGLTDIVELSVIITVSALLAWLHARAARQDAIVVELATSFLVGGQREVLDSLLSVLIGGEWRELRSGVPGKRLFEVLIELARKGTWEDRRRIAEAAPALAVIDRDAIIPVLRLLRDDFDTGRYHSDTRRRVVEALTVSSGRSKPLVRTLSPDEVDFFLSYRHNDGPYTALAIAETLAHLSSLPRARPVAQRLVDRLRAQVSAALAPDEAAAVELSFELARLASTDWAAARMRIGEVLLAGAPLAQVAAARLAVEHLEHDAVDGINLLQIISDSRLHRNVRRVAAREKAIKFLIRCIARADTQPAAMTLLLDLLGDQDEIIPRSVFDIVEFGLRGHPNLLKACCEVALRAQRDPELSQRARRCLSYLHT